MDAFMCLELHEWSSCFALGENGLTECGTAVKTNTLKLKDKNQSRSWTGFVTPCSNGECLNQGVNFSFSDFASCVLNWDSQKFGDPDRLRHQPRFAKPLRLCRHTDFSDFSESKKSAACHVDIFHGDISGWRIGWLFQATLVTAWWLFVSLHNFPSANFSIKKKRTFKQTAFVSAMATATVTVAPTATEVTSAPSKKISFWTSGWKNIWTVSKKTVFPVSTFASKQMGQLFDSVQNFLLRVSLMQYDEYRIILFWTQDVCHSRKDISLATPKERGSSLRNWRINSCNHRAANYNSHRSFDYTNSSQWDPRRKQRIRSGCRKMFRWKSWTIPEKKTRSQVGRTKDRKTLSQKERERQSEFCKICSKIGNIGASLFVTGIQWCCSVRQRFLVTFGRVEPNLQREMLCLKRENASPLCGLDLLLVSGRRMINLTLRGLSFRNVEVACILEEVLGKCACSYRFLSRLASCVWA